MTESKNVATTDNRLVKCEETLLSTMYSTRVYVGNKR
jgi:hypothetical protein